MHRGGEWGTYDRRDPDQYRAAGDQPRVPDSDDGGYRKILEKAPDHSDALHFSGVLAHQQGRSDEAVALIERSLDLDPNQADCYSNLGIIFKARGKFAEAVDAYQHALALNPN